MKFGFMLPNYGGKIDHRGILRISKVCEEEGFDSAWTTDHIIVPTEFRDPYGQLFEPMVTLSFVAAATEKLRVGTSSIVLPQRNPILVAKQAASLDVFSGGRVILGLGIGWSEKEFGFLGADFRRRGRIMVEGVKLIRSLWREEVVDFEGRYFRVKGAVFLPKPILGSIPIWVAGNSDAAVRRAIQVGDGWHPVGLDLDGYRKGAKKIAESGRKLTLSLRIMVDLRKKRDDTVGSDGGRRTSFSGGAADVRKSVEAYASAGMEYCCAQITHPAADEIIEDIRRFSAEVMKSYL